MPLIYNGKKIIPAPLVSIKRASDVTEDGKEIGQTYTITLTGQLVAYKGSPDSSGVFWTNTGYPPDEVVTSDSRLTAILRKQQALDDLFRNQGKTLEIQPFDGAAPVTCNPRVISVEFEQGRWFETVPYTITLEADYIEGLNTDNVSRAGKIKKANEEWNLESLDETRGTYRLTHSVSATGKRVYDETGALLDGNEAWENAKDYVLSVLELGLTASRMEAPDVLDATSLQAFNYIRTQAINETAGDFLVTESWVCFDPGGLPPAIHDYTVTTRTNSQDGRTSVSIEGTITGFEVRNNTNYALASTRWENAKSAWDDHISPSLLTLIGDITDSAVSLNPIAVSSQVGRNEAAGTITYSYEYDNRPTPTIVGSLSETITITNHNAANIYAKVPVIGRSLGPVLQDIGTVTEKRRTINIELQMPPSAQGYTASQPNTDTIVNTLKPSSANGVFLDSDEESWTPNAGRYTRTTTYTWE